jgi:pimeloyl-ACP methyl ester carboxylesterase
MFADAGSAVLAEIHGPGMDLSQEPWRVGDDEFAALAVPTLLVSSEDSPAVFSTVNERLASSMPHAVRTRVSDGHLISPAHPVVLDYVRRLLQTAG